MRKGHVTNLAIWKEFLEAATDVDPRFALMVVGQVAGVLQVKEIRVINVVDMVMDERYRPLMGLIFALEREDLD